MNIDRLNDLIRVMEGVRDAGRAFDIGTWAELDSSKPDHEVTLCNTACCAAGW